METFEALRTRRSVRDFLDKGVEIETINGILEAGRWAPSGLNNQPWRFKIVDNSEVKNSLAEETHYGDVIKSAPLCIVVFLDQKASYDRVKDLQAIGASIQNMLLYIHSMGLGGCWLGEILGNKDRVSNILKVPNDYELMAVIAVGYPVERARGSERKDVGGLLL
ncbi:MAG: nitroreductase family protein [Candidatus Altiarchaeota archaeon]|nr:nitroreductase family protein [Candidatus Altiarchaeota archaeon]